AARGAGAPERACPQRRGPVGARLPRAASERRGVNRMSTITLGAFDQLAKQCVTRAVSVGLDREIHEDGVRVLREWCREREIDPFKITTAQAQQLKRSLPHDEPARGALTRLFH